MRPITDEDFAWNSMSTNVFLDDLRDAPDGWVVFRTAEACKYLLRAGQVNNLSLDHDLGDGFLTGYDLVKWMVDKDIWPKGEITIHSQNLIGARNMQALIDNFKRFHNRY